MRKREILVESNEENGLELTPQKKLSELFF